MSNRHFAEEFKSNVTPTYPIAAYFFTESSLRHLLNTAELGCVQTYGCTVLADEVEISKHLQSIEL